MSSCTGRRPRTGNRGGPIDRAGQARRARVTPHHCRSLLAATAVGDAIGLKVGKFEPGYKFDAIAVNIDAPQSNLRYCPKLDSDSDFLEKIVLNVTRSNISKVWVDGTIVAGN